MGIAGIIFAVLALAFPIIPTIGWALTAISLLTGHFTLRHRFHALSRGKPGTQKRHLGHRR